MKNIKRRGMVLLALVMLLSLCACGAQKASGLPQPAPLENGSYSEDAVYLSADFEDADYGLSAAAGSMSDASAKAANGDDAAEENPDKIIYSADVTVETTTFDETVQRISNLVETYGGWIEASSVSGSNYYQKSRGTASTRDASYTLRIPSARFRELMGSLSDLGNVPYSHIYTENVTTRYYDAQAHLKAYQTQETRLLEMMELAETVEDVIIIEDRLTELRYQIESLQSSLNNWDRKVSYSTVYLSIKEVREYTPEEKVNPSYGEELAQALKDGLHNAGQFLKDLLVFLVEVLPVLVILVPIVWLLVWLIRKLAAKGRLRREEKAAKKRAEKKKKDPSPSDGEASANK